MGILLLQVVEHVKKSSRGLVNVDLDDETDRLEWEAETQRIAYVRAHREELFASLDMLRSNVDRERGCR